MSFLVLLFFGWFSFFLWSPGWYQAMALQVLILPAMSCTLSWKLSWTDSSRVGQHFLWFYNRYCFMSSESFLDLSGQVPRVKPRGKIGRLLSHLEGLWELCEPSHWDAGRKSAADCIRWQSEVLPGRKMRRRVESDFHLRVSLWDLLTAILTPKRKTFSTDRV